MAIPKNNLNIKRASNTICKTPSRDALKSLTNLCIRS